MISKTQPQVEVREVMGGEVGATLGSRGSVIVLFNGLSGCLRVLLSGCLWGVLFESCLCLLVLVLDDLILPASLGRSGR